MRGLVRAFGLRCPHCGTSWPRTRLVLLVARCPRCGLRLDRGESDYFLGSYTVNLLVGLAAAAALAVVGVAFPIGPPALIGVGLPAIAILVVAFHPLSRLIWLAGDLLIRPASARDFDPERGAPPD